MYKIKSADRIRFLTRAGVIAAVYVALTAVSAIFGLSSGVIQVRLSEMLCVLPVYTTAAIPGVTVGCLISNLIFGGTAYDVIFGTLATLVGALLTLLFRKLPYLSPTPAVVSNTLVIPLVFISSGMGMWDMYPLYALFVFLGESVSCGIFGCLLIFLIRRNDGMKKILSD